MSNKLQVLIFSAFILAIALSANAETLQLTSSGTWQQSSQTDQSFQQQIANFKKFINQGDPDKLENLAKKLKKQYPDLAGEDFDAFTKAETLFAQNDYLKAVKQYQDFLETYPQSIYYEPVMERLYDIAVIFLNGKRVTRLKVLRLKAYDEAAKIMENIAEKAGNSPIAKRALITLAQSLEKRGQYLDAYQRWSDIYSRWPTSQTAQTALLAMARSLHSSYKGYKYNSTNLESAKSYYNDFITRYPQQAKELELIQQIHLIEEQKAYKQYEVADFYERSGHTQSAALYYQAVIDQWPKSAAAQLAKSQLRQIQTGQNDQKRGLFSWWFQPKNEDNMFFFDLPDKEK